MFEMLDMTKDNLLAFKVKGEIRKEDYDKINDILEKTGKEHEKLKLFIDMESIEGIKPAALWEDFKTYFRHIGKIRRIAVVGESGITKTLTQMANPFIRGKVKFFPREETVPAREWITRDD